MLRQFPRSPDIERIQRLTKLRIQVVLGVELVTVGVETAKRHEENLPLHVRATHARK